MTAAEIIDLLGLERHPEGGWFREVYRSEQRVESAVGIRCASTAIFFLIDQTTKSALHRVATDEVFHHYVGDSVEQLLLHPDGHGELRVLGKSLEAGERPLCIVPAGCWQGARVVSGGAWALLGATVAPGFDFQDFEIATRGELPRAYPDWADLIRQLEP